MTEFTRPDRPPDWADTYHGPMRDPSLTARQAFFRGLETPPAWLSAAMGLRRLVVAPFGLRGPPEGTGHFLGRLPVVADRPDHYECGLPDRHLTFTIATRVRGDIVGFTTAIWFNRTIGRVYLQLIMPGHILAARQLAGQMAHPLTRSLGEFPEGPQA